jgi:peptidoglycan hydrolase-like protein with peptidoglycan-binding domain
MRRVAIGVALAALVIGIAAGKPSAQPRTLPAPQPVPIAEASPSTSPSPSPSPSPSTSPSPSISPKPSVSPKPKPCEKNGGYQIIVEEAIQKLGGFGPVTVDGVQSEADCAAIKKFQIRYGLRPTDGVAGPASGGLAKRLMESDPAQCQAGAGIYACVDLTHQTTWLMKDGSVYYGPTVTRTGFAGHVTRAGSFKIQWRAIKDWSEPYSVWLPYWQAVDGGNGFHETTTYIHNYAIGSHGCINLLHDDAVKYWNELHVGSPVNVFGHRPGT